MDIRQIMSALAVAKFRSFSEAAEHTAFSQSAVSKQVNSLEEELGVKIFDRRQQAQSAVPTELGEEILKKLDKISTDYNDLCLMAKNYAAQETQPIVLGSAPALGSFGEDVLMAEFILKNPQHEVYHLIGGSLMLTDMLKSSRIDAAVIAVGTILWPEAYFRDFVRSNRCIAVPLMKSRLTVGMSKDHPLADRESVRLIELKDETFLLRNAVRAGGFSFYPGKHESFMELCRREGFLPHIKTVDDYSSKLRLQMIDNGGGVMLNTSCVLMPYERVRFVPVEPQPYPIIGYFVALGENGSPGLAAMTSQAKVISRRNGFGAGDIIEYLPAD